MMKSKGLTAMPKAKFNKANYIKLLKYLKPHTFSVVLILFASVLSVALMITCALMLRELTNIINTAAQQSALSSLSMSELMNFSRIVFLCAILAAAYGTSVLCTFIQNFILSKVIQVISKRLRGEIIEKINRLPLSYFDSHQYGDMLSRVTNDVDTISQALSSTVSSLISSVIQIIGVLIAMLIVSWQMTLTSLATLPVSFLFLALLMKFSQKFFVGQQKNLGAVNADIEEMYSGQSIIKAFNAEQALGKRFHTNNSNLQKSMYKANIISGLSYPLMGFVSKLGYIAVCVVGGVLYTNGNIDLGALTAFIIFVNMFQSPVNQLGQVMSTLQGGSAAAGRVFELLAEAEETDESNKTLKLDTKQIQGNVEFNNVKFGYNSDKTVINNFNLKVSAGQKIAVVGPTGAGKTTLVNLLMRFYEINGGSISVDGVPINELKRNNVRSLFSMVLQDAWLFEGTVRDNLTFGNNNITSSQLDEATKAANAYHFIQSLSNGYDHILSNETAVSAGQKQLLTIARAMLEDSPILILDEATSNVDTRTEQLIQSAMDKLSKGRTSFVIAHRLSTIKNADVILVLKDGDIIEQGNHNALINQCGFYKELYESQFNEASN